MIQKSYKGIGKHSWTSPKPSAKPYRLNLRRFESAPCGRPIGSQGSQLFVFFPTTFFVIFSLETLPNVLDQVYPKASPFNEDHHLQLQRKTRVEILLN